MSICAADMETCDRKAKCLFGINEGKTYDPKDPCCGYGYFDAATCDCIRPQGNWVFSGIQTNSLSGGEIVQDEHINCDRPARRVGATVSQSLLDQGAVLSMNPVGLSYFSCSPQNSVEFVPPDVNSVVCAPGDCNGASLGCSMRMTYIDSNGDPEYVTLIGSALALCDDRSGVPTGICGGCSLTGDWVFIPDD